MNTKPAICFVHTTPIKKNESGFYTIVASRTAELLGDSASIYYAYIGEAIQRGPQDPDLVYAPCEGILAKVPVLRNISLILHLRKLGKKYRIGAFINVWDHYFIFPILFGARLANAKVIARISGIPIGTNPANSTCRKLRKTIGLASEWVSLKLADRILFLSNSLAENYRDRKVNLARSHVISQGCNTSRFHFAPKEDNGKSVARILYVGRIAPKKGIEDALLAIADITGTFEREVRFVIAGFGDHTEELKLQVNHLGIAGYVEFLGYVKHSKLFGLYKSCDVLVLPSRSEGLPNVVLEAMACGLPVVASAVGGIPELLADGRGFLVRPNDPGHLAEMIREVLRDPMIRKSAVGRARDYVEKEHSFSVIKAKFMKMLEEVLSEGLCRDRSYR